MSISAISMRNDLQKLDQLSHNIANLNTTAYKRTLSVTESFAHTLSRIENTHQAHQVVTNTIPSIATEKSFEPGALNFTDNPLNLAIEGNGFFELTNKSGTYYSKRGDFVLDNNGQVKLSGSDLTLNGFGGDIRLQSAEPTITTTGRVLENEEEIAQIKVVHFDNPNDLLDMGRGIFQPSEASRPKEVELPAIRQSYLEASNSQPAEEMLNLIQLARHIEATQQVIRGYDDMLGTVFEDLGRF